MDTLGDSMRDQWGARGLQ